ncbi:hypothetical protein JHD47_04140, partial [Sulfurimonas sp. SAG-AH-194-L11]
MSKVKNRYTPWCSKEQYHSLMSYPTLISKEVQLYKLKDDIKFHKSIKADTLHLPETLKFFTSQENNLNFEKKVKKYLRSISKYDVVFHYKDNNYLFHTYKILGFIQESINALTLAKDFHFQKSTIGNYNER